MRFVGQIWCPPLKSGFCHSSWFPARTRRCGHVAVVSSLYGLVYSFLCAYFLSISLSDRFAFIIFGYVSMCRFMHMSALQRHKHQIPLEPGTRTGGCDPSWEPDSNPLKEQRILLTLSHVFSLRYLFYYLNFIQIMAFEKKKLCFLR